MRRVLIALAGLAVLVAAPAAFAGPVDEMVWKVEPGESWYGIAYKLAPECTAAQRDVLAKEMARLNGATLKTVLHPDRRLAFPPSIVPDCEVTSSTVATSTTSVPSTVAPTSTSETPPPSTVSTTSTPSTGSSTSAPTPGAPLASVPTLSQVGPRGSLASRSGTALPCGTYQSVRFTSTVELSACQYTFIDADIPGMVSRYLGYVGPGPKVTFSHSVVRSGIWFEDGGHAGWTAEWTQFNSSGFQALRPKGPGTITITDSLVTSAGTPLDNPNIHTEAFQAMGGANVIATRVGFSIQPRWSGSFTPITAVFTFESGFDGAGSTLTDCEFGYLQPDGTWVRGGGHYAIYPAKASFVRPRIHASQSQAFYSTPVSLSDPVYL